MRIIIIDDEAARLNMYQTLFAVFKDGSEDLTFVSSYEDYSHCVQNLYKFDLVVLDAYLWDGEDAISVLRKAKLGKTPVVIISDKFFIKYEVNHDFLELMKNPNVIEIMDLKSYSISEEKDINTFQFKIRLAIAQYYNHTSEYKDDDETIRILHMSDMQFGGAVSDLAYMDEARIPDLLRQNNMIPDLILVSGDIVNNGLPEQYTEALNWFKRFSNNLWEWSVSGNITSEEMPPRIYDRFIFVPGNHDFNMDVTCASQYEFDWKNHTFIKRSAATDKYTSLGFYYYNEFLNQFYHNEKTENYSRSFIINAKYAPWGLQFVLLNTATTISPDNPSPGKKGPTVIDFDDASNVISDNKAIKSSFNIVLSHYSPVDMGWMGGDESKQRSWTRFKSILGRLNAPMICFGHLHQELIPEINRNAVPNFISCPSPSLRLDGTARTEGSMPGFNIIELTRNNKMVTNINIIQCRIDGNGMISQNSLSEFDIIYSDNGDIRIAYHENK